MTRDKVLAWLREHAVEPVLFSDVSRALITNVERQRARSPEARAELRTILAGLQDDGVVSLTTKPDRRSGITITVLDLEQPPLSPSTHERKF